MENTFAEKSLADLVQNPSELSAIISDPAESGIKFYQSLKTKDKSYVAFAAGVGLLAYGLYLSRSSSNSSTNKGGSTNRNTLAASADSAGAHGNASGSESNNKSTSTKELDVKRKNK